MSEFSLPEPEQQEPASFGPVPAASIESGAVPNQVNPDTSPQTAGEVDYKGLYIVVQNSIGNKVQPPHYKEDVVQNTMEGIFRLVQNHGGIPTDPETGKRDIRALAASIARIRVKDHYRKLYRRDEVEETPPKPADPDSEDLFDEIPSLDEPTETRVLRALTLREAIEKLPPRQQQALELLAQDHPHKEIAAIIGTNVPALKVLISRARQNLRKLYNVEDDQ